MFGRLTGRRLPFLDKASEEGLKVSTPCGGTNGLFLEGSICCVPCLMLVDTGANVTPAEHSKICSVLAKEKAIPARSECLIKGIPEVSGKFRYAVTDFPSRVSQKGVLVAVKLVDLKREVIPVRVLNLDNKPKTVDKGAVIATCEPVVEIVARPQEFCESLRLPSILENLEGLNEEQRTAVKELLQEFQNLFSNSDSDSAAAIGLSIELIQIDDTLDALNGSQWFSTLDLKSGYWQVEIQPEDKEKTAFTTGQGL
ncbi:hypothetical protein AVEN_229133-1 [Araneus ventricosus]|uniref:Reverse transcriptase domain-containing protein n=1 Tax=Araneus ventricosus TaxID=182803 RepID=A0A4Y2QNJ6_ARAVE|nr:hypothetical protein AVEN_229133-1 [Araneus ventricosus]